MKRSGWAGVCLAGWVAASGCSWFKSMLAGGFEPPTLAFRSAALSDVSLSDATVVITFTVTNPNEQALSLAETDYQLLIEGKQVVAGKPAAGLGIPGKASADIALPASVRFAELAATVAALLEKQKASYRAEGHIGVDTPIGIVALPFAHEGLLELPKPPIVQLGAPRLTNLSLSGATLVVPLRLDNKNPFPLPLAGLSGTLRVEGAELGTLAAHDMGSLPARGRLEIALPIAFRYADALSAARALQSGHASIDLNGELQSGTTRLPFQLSQQFDLQR